MRVEIPNPPFGLSRIARVWWPLAASWMLMAAELPVLSAMIARLANPEINLAAYGGVVWPLALVIESPIIMLLSASTALSKDWASYLKVRRYMMVAGATLTALHVLVVFTPLYYVVVRGILGVPDAIVEPGRTGLMIMLPWSWSVAYRRFNQGVLIRFGHSRAVGVGTVIRLSSDLIVLFGGYLIGTIPGIVVASCAVALGVVSEAIYAGLVARPVIREKLAVAPSVEPILTYRAFFAFYIPLVFTSLFSLLATPIGSAALSRMPQALTSLAAWPVVTGLVFMIQALGIAFNEVVVTLLDEPDAAASLRRFTGILAGGITALLVVIAATPVAFWWFSQVSALTPDLATLARSSLWIALPMPALSTLQSWFQGAILHSRRTRGITEAVVLYLVSSVLVLGGGVAWQGMTGLYIGLAASMISLVVQTAWLWWRSRPALERTERPVASRSVRSPVVGK